MAYGERGKDMKVSEILIMDMRNKGSQEILDEALMRLPFFSEDSITTDDIETAIKKMQKKYPIILSYITTSAGANDDEPLVYYSFMVKRTDTHVHVKTVWAMSLREGLAKVALLMYSFINNVLKKESS